MDYAEEIKFLKEEKGAFICCHNFQAPPIHGVADFVGDSFELSSAAFHSGAELIVSCGVSFMSESIKLLCPKKKVLVPDKTAKCLSDQASVSDILEAKKQHPNAAVLLYANASAKTKAIADATCTSWSALATAKSLGGEIIFGSDKNVAAFLAKNSGKDIIPLKNSTSCKILDEITPDHVISLKKKHPGALVIGHPECSSKILEMSDIIGGTKTFIDTAKKYSGQKLIACTEAGIVFVMNKHSKSNQIFAANPKAICPEMQKTTMKKLYLCLKKEKFEVNIKKDVLEAGHKVSLKQLQLAEKMLKGGA